MALLRVNFCTLAQGKQVNCWEAKILEFDIILELAMSQLKVELIYQLKNGLDTKKIKSEQVRIEGIERATILNWQDNKLFPLMLKNELGEGK